MNCFNLNKKNILLVAKYDDVDFFLKSKDITVDYLFKVNKQVFGNTILDSDKLSNIDIRKFLTPLFSKKTVDDYEEMMIRPLIRIYRDYSRRYT
jgi:cytochrome P450